MIIAVSNTPILIDVIGGLGGPSHQVCNTRDGTFYPIRDKIAQV